MSKKTIYIIASMFLGLLISFIIHAEIEIWFIRKTLHSGLLPFSFGCREFLPPLLSLILALLGLAFGYIVGQRWWQIVYVEKRHWRKKK